MQPPRPLAISFNQIRSATGNEKPAFPDKIVKGCRPAPIRHPKNKYSGETEDDDQAKYQQASCFGVTDYQKPISLP